jgi:hypothetical protein
VLSIPVSAIASKIQPIGLCGALRATTKPTAANGAIVRKNPSMANDS